MAGHYTTMISGDSHIFEKTNLWRNALGDKYGDDIPHEFYEYRGKKGTFFYTGAQVLTVGGIDKEHKESGLHLSGYEPDRRIAYQRDANVLAEVIYPSYGLIVMQSRHHEALKAVAEVYNDWLYDDFLSYDTKRLLGVAMIPTVDVDWAVKELERCVKKGYAGVCVNCRNLEGTPPYRDPVYDPLWARCAEMGIPVTLHSITGRIHDPLHPHNEDELMDAPRLALDIYYEVQGTLGSDIIFGGVLDRHPDLKIVVAEFELSWLPNFAFRLDMIKDGFGSRITLPKLTMQPSDYLRERCWFGWIDDGRGKLGVDEVGADRVMWGSDFPHVRSVGVDAQSAVGKMLAELPPQDQDKIVGLNTAALYNIDYDELYWTKQAAE